MEKIKIGPGITKWICNPKKAKKEKEEKPEKRGFLKEKEKGKEE